MAAPKEIIVLGNGQLGLLLSKAAKNLNIPFKVFSLSEAWTWVKGDPDQHSLITFEQEHIDEDLLSLMKSKGLESFPTWENFQLLKSKRQQKELVQKLGIPTSDFVSILHDPSVGDQFIQKYKGAVLKAGKGGYDGKGVWVIDAKGQCQGQDWKDLLPNIREPYLERLVSYSYEMAAVVGRSKNQTIAQYPTVKSIQKEGICYQVEYSEPFTETKVAQEGARIAKKIATEISYIGVLAVELFVENETVLVNEIAPRVHNSGHFTIDVCAGSQFENHLLAGIGKDLKPTKPIAKAALMTNLLWPESEKEFAPLYSKLTCGSPWPENAKLHWYGKSEIRKNRKMGHFTVYGDSLAECHQIAQQILASRWVER
ncbi:MAG: ATP-grasp domain-containing protein [Oligoflexia bacterium]|nr:ATP-grasp domain-containing protein [Oligoflexia bacterium]